MDPDQLASSEANRSGSTVSKVGKKICTKCIYYVKYGSIDEIFQMDNSDIELG